MKALLLAILFALGAPAAYGQAALVTHTSAVNSAGSAVTTPAMDITGANLVVCGVSMLEGSSSSSANITDAVGSTWAALTVRDSLVSVMNRIFWAIPATAGSGYTVTFNLSGSKPGIACFVFSGSVASPFDQQNGAGGSTGISLAAGAVTPGFNNEIIVSFAGITSANGGSAGADSGMTTPEPGSSGANSFFIAGAYKIQGTLAAITPAWGWLTSSDAAVTIATFKGTAPSTTASHLMLMGIN